MFALLLSEKMYPFYQNIGSFPTAIFTTILCACLIYWIFAVIGLIDLNLLDLDMDVDVDVDFSGPEGVDGAMGDASSADLSSMNMVAGLLVRFGLFGVPMIIMLSFFGLFGWIISYLVVHYLFGDLLGTLWRFPLGLVVLLGASYCSAWITAYAIRPMRKIFEQAHATHNKQLIGQHAVVRTSRVDEKFGEAVLEDGGAGLILQVRSADEQPLSKGDRVVLLEYEAEGNFYRAILAERMTD